MVRAGWRWTGWGPVCRMLLGGVPVSVRSLPPSGGRRTAAHDRPAPTLPSDSGDGTDPQERTRPDLGSDSTRGSLLPVELVTQVLDLRPHRGRDKCLIGGTEGQYATASMLLNVATSSGSCVWDSTLFAPSATETRALSIPPPRWRNTQNAVPSVNMARRATLPSFWT